MRNNLREFCVDVNHILNVDDASRIDVVPPTPPPTTAAEPLLSQPATEPSVQVVPPQVQRQIDGPKAKGGKRVATETKGGEKKKKKRQQIVSDEEDEVIRKRQTNTYI